MYRDDASSRSRSPPVRLALDHLAVAADSLAQGTAHVREALGLDIPPGGRHPLMGTHNRLMRLGEDEFLEVIAIDPDAPPPVRPRWFALDRRAERRPRLATWIVRTDDLDGALARLPRECGPAVGLERDGLRWRLSVPEDGSMPFDGAFPTVIEWPMRPLPATRMAERGAALERLVVRHPEAERARALLEPYLDDPRVAFERAETISLEARVVTPDGVRTLR